MQPGDVPATHADVEDFWRATDFRPATPLTTGIEVFARWYCDFYGDEDELNLQKEPGQPGPAEATQEVRTHGDRNPDYRHANA